MLPSPPRSGGFGDLVNFSSFELSTVTSKANPFVVPSQHQLTEEKKHFVILNEEFDLYLLHPCVIVSPEILSALL